MIVAEALNNDLKPIPQYGNNYAEGDTGQLRLYLLRILYADELSQIENDILSTEAEIRYIKQDASMLVIGFRKGFDPLTIIATAVSAIASILIAWQLVKDSANPVPVWIWLAVGGVMVGMAATLVWERKKASRKKKAK